MQLRPLSIGELLDRTFSLYRNNFVLFVGIGAIPQLLIVLLVIVGAGAVGVGAVATRGPMGAVTGALVAVPFVIFGYVGAWALSQGAATYALSQRYMERTATIVESYRFAMKRFWPLLLLVVTIFCIVGASFIVGILALIVGSVIGACLAMCFCSLAVPVMMLEGRGVMDSLNRSYRLAKTDLGRVFLVMLVAVAIQYAAIYLALIPSFALMIVFSQNQTALLWINLLSNLVQVTAAAVAAPLLPIGFALTYYDIRVRQEALDLQMMMAALGPAAAPGAPAGAAASATGAGTS